VEMMLHFKRVERPAAGVYGGLCVAPYHFKHFDELLADIGASKRRRNPLAEMFTPPDADAYAQFLASAPDYKAVISPPCPAVESLLNLPSCHPPKQKHEQDVAGSEKGHIRTHAV